MLGGGLYRRRAIVEGLQRSLKLELIGPYPPSERGHRVQKIESYFLYSRIISVAAFNPGLRRSKFQEVYIMLSTLVKGAVDFTTNQSLLHGLQSCFSGCSCCNCYGVLLVLMEFGFEEHTNNILESRQYSYQG